MYSTSSWYVYMHTTSRTYLRHKDKNLILYVFPGCSNRELGHRDIVEHTSSYSSTYTHKSCKDAQDDAAHTRYEAHTRIKKYSLQSRAVLP